MGDEMVRNRWAKLFILALLFSSWVGSAKSLLEVQTPAPKYNLDIDKILYVVGYAHLDTQWLWTYRTTIDQYLRDTLDQNFANFEKFPDYTFNFTGSVRYEMLKEYYPEGYERVKELISEGRWFVSGSSVDEGDVNVPSPEAIIRQVLYGNEYFRKEFGKESWDFMLPDCFGFPAEQIFYCWPETAQFVRVVRSFIAGA